ncbi:MAG TPA: alpha/beta hydrolase [Dehalococcoidia bacterium]|nr:alpha/beta hydrolase [Dehalococcoidia bacterium]
MTDAVFLPGASGRRAYWQPVAERLRLDGEALLLGWPGFGDTPADTGITSLRDLPGYVQSQIQEPVDLVAQSMGGVVALMVALQRPDLVRSLVLCGTSGGIDLARFDAEDWRTSYLQELPETTPRWFADDRSDLTNLIPSIAQPVLLLWGEDDRVSPPALGRYLAGLLPNASFLTIPHTSHMLAEEQPGPVARHMQVFLDELNAEWNTERVS